MKLLRIAIIAVLFALVLGCSSSGFLMAKAEVTMLTQTYPSKSDQENIDIFNTNLPTKGYQEIALISCGDTNDDWNMQQILLKAREIGADGIIITGRVGSYGAFFPSGTMAIGASESYGLTAVAIKYHNE